MRLQNDCNHSVFSVAKDKWVFFFIVKTVLYPESWTNCDACIVDGQLDWDFSSRKVNPEFHAQEEDRGEHSDRLEVHQIFRSILLELWSQILLADLCNRTFLDQLDWDFSSRKVNAISQGFSHKKTHNGESTLAWRWSDLLILLRRGMVKDPSKINDKNGCNCAFLSSQRQKWVQTSVIVEIAHRSLCTNCDACIADEPSAGLRISIKRWMQNLQNFTHKKKTNRKDESAQSLTIIRFSWSFAVLRDHSTYPSMIMTRMIAIAGFFSFFLCCQRANEHYR
jgi:hypothetical protein